MAEAPDKLPTRKTSALAEAGSRSPFETLRREVDRLFENFYPLGRHFPSRAFGLEVPRLSAAEWAIAPAVDIAEKDDSYEITAELPGLNERDVDIKLSSGTLTIKGEKSVEKEDERKDYYLSERHYGSFQRSFQVPEGVDADKIDATFSKGVLTVKLPKTPEAKKMEKRIDIKAA